MSQTGALRPVGREPGHQVVALSLAVLLTVVAIDVALVGRISVFFDLCFVVMCVAMAVLVRPPDYFTMGVLPPLLMLGVFGFLAFTDPGVIARPDDNVVQAVVSGLAMHSGALVSGYLLCLAVLGWRRRPD